MAYLIPVVIILALIYNSIKVLMEYERGVIFFLGKFQQVKGPGVIIVIPVLQRMMRVNLQTITMDVPTQDVITRDNVSVKVNAVIFFRVVDPQRAMLAVQDYLYSTSQIAQTTLRSVLGQSQLDELLSKREEINVELQRIIDQQTEPWGVKVHRVEIRDVGVPEQMQRAMARQAEAERERHTVLHHDDDAREFDHRAQGYKNLHDPTTGFLRPRYSTGGWFAPFDPLAMHSSDAWESGGGV